jgi:hypothetical protein
VSVDVDIHPPKLLLAEPAPRPQNKLFHRRRIQVWEGEVAVDRVTGWVLNRRTELLVDDWRDEYGRDPDDDELAELVTEDAAQRIKRLAANIARNGVRVPIILSKDGRLLDGNRRYFAVRHLLASDKDRDRSDFRKLPAWVLASTTGDEDEADVVTELNLVDDERLKWPYSIQARQVFEDNRDRGMTVKEIADRYDLDTSQVRQRIAAVELSEEFLGYRRDDDDDGRSSDARRLVYDNLIWFDQLARSHSRLLDNDSEFKEGVFEMLLEDPPKFSQARELIKLGDIRKSPAAWAKLRGVAGPAGLEQAQQVLASEKLDAQKDPLGKLERATKLLEEIADAPELHRADPQLLERFHRSADQIPAAAGDPSWRVGRMRDWLNEMTVDEVDQLPPDALAMLGESHERVLTMAESWKTRRRN